MRWLRLHNVPLLRQLRLEEALYRARDQGSWLVTNTFGPAGYDDTTSSNQTPAASDRHVQAIAMGISGKPEELVNEERFRTSPVPIIRRFTGGGTVVIDSGSLLVSLISSTRELPHVPPYPNELMRWTATDVYAPILGPYTADSFQLNEQDYCLRERKVGGNAQAISGGRWVHHTSFLWDFDVEHCLALLRLPRRRPEYRGERSHADFLVGLSAVLPNRAAFWERLGPAVAAAFRMPNDSFVEVLSASGSDDAALAMLEHKLESEAGDATAVLKTRPVDWLLPE